MSSDGELVDAIFCSRCGELTSLDDHRCDACGEQFPEPPSILRMRLERLRQPDKHSKRKLRLAPARSTVRLLILVGVTFFVIAWFLSVVVSLASQRLFFVP
jgi:uncharacterized membrane protein YvbJ